MIKKIIITNDILKFSAIEVVDFVDVNKFNNPAPDNWKDYSLEFKPFIIAESIIDERSVIGIDFELPQDLKYNIAHQLITSTHKTCVFFISDLSDIKLNLENDLGLFRNEFVEIRNIEETKLIFDDSAETNRVFELYHDKFSYEKYKVIYQRFVDFDRHQITNEWGAIKLLLNHGLTLEEIETGYQISKTIFFKQKLREYRITKTNIINYSTYSKEASLLHEQSILNTNLNKIKKILLIDDNASKGWGFALKMIFSAANITVIENFHDANIIADFSIYDFIFLDLRLPNSSSDNTISMQNGMNLIKKIKGLDSSLHIPLIIFTASQKASTLDDIIQEGADAMYVKEAIDLNVEQSLENYHDFVKEINFQFKKYEHLKKYRLAIQKIKTSFITQIVDSPNLLFKTRIEERLEMFYGLIKNKYEQSDYNENRFHYSADRLSFMTLWSLLNDVQECYFEKVKDTINLAILSGSPLTRQNGTIFEYISRWHIAGQTNDIYFEKDKIGLKINSLGEFKSDSNGDYLLSYYTTSHFNYLAHTAPYYKTRQGGRYVSNSKIIQPEQKLSFQVAFLLLEKNELKTSHRLNAYLRTLKSSNDERNKLYLTHGEDSSTNFYASPEKTKSLPANATFELFQLVSFLLTGDDTIV